MAHRRKKITPINPVAMASPERPSNALAATDLVMYNVGTVCERVAQLQALLYGNVPVAALPEELQAPMAEGAIPRIEQLANIANWRLSDAANTLAGMLKHFDTPTGNL